MNVRDKMEVNPLCLKLEQTAFTAKELMLLNDLECLYVVDDDRRPVGVVTSVAASAETGRTKIRKILNEEIATVREDQTIVEAALIFSKKDYNRVTIPVVDSDGCCVGIIRMRDLIGVLSVENAVSSERVNIGRTIERASIGLAMSTSPDEEKTFLTRIRSNERLAAVTQVGANAEKLPVKMREAAVVAAIAHGVIKESAMEKVAVTHAIRDIINQLDTVAPGLGGGYKLGIVRGEGRVAVCAFGRCGHALANSSEFVFLGSAVI